MAYMRVVPLAGSTWWRDIAPTFEVQHVGLVGTGTCACSDCGLRWRVAQIREWCCAVWWNQERLSMFETVRIGEKGGKAHCYVCEGDYLSIYKDQSRCFTYNLASILNTSRSRVERILLRPSSIMKGLSRRLALWSPQIYSDQSCLFCTINQKSKSLTS